MTSNDASKKIIILYKKTVGVYEKETPKRSLFDFIKKEIFFSSNSDVGERIFHRKTFLKNMKTYAKLALWENLRKIEV